MSEYQYYEFQAIDRPLDHAAQDSSRARITATSFINHYEWGDLKGDGTLVRPPPLSDRLWQAAYFAGKTRRLRHAGQPGTLRMRTQELRKSVSVPTPSAVRRNGAAMQRR